MHLRALGYLLLVAGPGVLSKSSDDDIANVGTGWAQGFPPAPPHTSQQQVPTQALQQQTPPRAHQRTGGPHQHAEIHHLPSFTPPPLERSDENPVQHHDQRQPTNPVDRDQQGPNRLVHLSTEPVTITDFFGLDPDVRPTDPEIRTLIAHSRAQRDHVLQSRAAAVTPAQKRQLNVEFTKYNDHLRRLNRMLARADPNTYLGSDPSAPPVHHRRNLRASGTRFLRAAQADPDPAGRMLALQSARHRLRQILALPSHPRPAPLPRPRPPPPPPPRREPFLVPRVPSGAAPDAGRPEPPPPPRREPFLVPRVPSGVGRGAGRAEPAPPPPSGPGSKRPRPDLGPDPHDAPPTPWRHDLRHLLGWPPDTGTPAHPLRAASVDLGYGRAPPTPGLSPAPSRLPSPSQQPQQPQQQQQQQQQHPQPHARGGSGSPSTLSDSPFSLGALEAWLHQPHPEGSPDRAAQEAQSRLVRPRRDPPR